MQETLPFGSWPSPLSAAVVSVSPPRIDGAAFVGNDIWWGETVAAEAGRTAVRRKQGDDVVDVLPAPWNARSRVHEYGGGSWAADPSGVLFFVERTDQRIWMLAPGSNPTPLTPEAADVSHGGLRWSSHGLLAVRETTSPDRSSERAIIRVRLASDPVTDVLVSGSEFVAQPALSPDGTQLAWVSWQHPNLPWDNTELRVGAIGAGRVEASSAAKAGHSSALQPEWLPDGSLLFVDDVTGRWNIWRYTQGTSSAVFAADADTGGPLWVLGARWYAPLANGDVVTIQTNGDDTVSVRRSDGSSLAILPELTAGTNIEAVAGSKVLVSGAGAQITPGLWVVDINEPGNAVPIRGGETDATLPRPRIVTYEGPHGPVHAIDYAPAAAPAPVSYQASQGELPPYIVFVHGGPTAHVSAAASAKIAFWTTRGVGALDVNYGGSTGYGRAYRERLRGQWGIVDVDDVVAATEGLVAEGRVDPSRIAIAGGSAGGWTVLSALVRTNIFAAGISRYGVADARALASDSHDFESRYLDGLIGPLPEAEAIYLERSPLAGADKINAPVLLLQGSDDRVVPPSQSEAIRDALAAQGVPHAYVEYEGEGHGFRRAETVVDALEKELAFLGAVFGFDTPGIPPLTLS